MADPTTSGKSGQRISPREERPTAELQAQRLVGKVSALEEAVIQLEQATREIEARVSEALSRIGRIEATIRDVVAGEAKGAFQFFDKAAMSILSEMKNELVKGVGRIQAIESLVTGKTEAEERLLGGEEIMGALLASGAQPEAVAATRDEETHTDLDTGTERPRDVASATVAATDEEPSSDDILGDLGKSTRPASADDEESSSVLNEIAAIQESIRNTKATKGNAKGEPRK